MFFLIGELCQIKGIIENIYQWFILYVCVFSIMEFSINFNMLMENDISIFRVLFFNNIMDVDVWVLL